MYKIIFLLIATFILCPGFLSSQKKSMTPDVYNEWNRIQDRQISKNGDWILYSLTTEVGDETLKIYHTRDKKTITFHRSSNPQFDASGNYVIFNTTTPYDTIRKLKLAKTKKNDLPGDTLTIFDTNNNTLTKIENVKNHKLSSKWGQHLIAHLDVSKTKKDTIKGPSKMKKESDANGSKLLVIDLSSNTRDTLHYITSYELAVDNPGLAMVSTGDDSLYLPGVYIYDFNNHSQRPLISEKGDYYNLSFSKEANHLAFTADIDTTDNKIRPYHLYLSLNGNQAQKIADDNSPFLQEGMLISNHRKPLFSENGKKIFYGMNATPLLPDTTLLDDEKPVVEVWNTSDGRLYTQQKVRLNREKKKNYLCVYDINSRSNVALADEKVPDVPLTRNRSDNKFFGTSDEPYLKYISWEGTSYSDLYTIDASTGNKILVEKKIPASLNKSINGNYAIWYNREERQYYSFNLATNKKENISHLIPTSLSNELHDAPSHPSSYGTAGWTKDDKYILIYDRYDIWKVDPDGKEKPLNLTNGRAENLRYRYIKLNSDIDYIDMAEPLYLHVFNDNNKSSGYSHLLPSGELKELVHSPNRYARRIIKAKESNHIIFTREDFATFPDLIHSTLDFQNEARVSNANPQQENYFWGSGQLYKWKNEKGQDMTGMLFIPEGFDKSKKYPMLVNFYEKSSDGIYNHRAPYAHRSTINYTYYLSKGIVIFNPDVPYTIGYPGQSGYDASVSGVEAILKEGFIDPQRIGIQGHSWGGYQIAHILTKTDIFACAEAGAPVVNMVSAYGGIRWGSGMSRQFQYEKTQSRLGATLWENPELYLENSPIFNIDKVNTPVLILHNDNDGAVPWYQGIEYFVALRRLDKKAWMLNYNGEPHWPVKWPNRLDFQSRMEHFFDHYLLKKEAPDWMKNGVPAIEKEVNLGY